MRSKTDADNSKPSLKYPLAQFFPAPCKPATKLSGSNSLPISFSRTESNTPDSKSTKIARGTYRSSAYEMWTRIILRVRLPREVGFTFTVQIKCKPERESDSYYSYEYSIRITNISNVKRGIDIFIDSTGDRYLHRSNATNYTSFFVFCSKFDEARRYYLRLLFSLLFSFCTISTAKPATNYVGTRVYEARAYVGDTRARLRILRASTLEQVRSHFLTTFLVACRVASRRRVACVKRQCRVQRVACRVLPRMRYEKLT